MVKGEKSGENNHIEIHCAIHNFLDSLSSFSKVLCFYAEHHSVELLYIHEVSSSNTDNETDYPD